MLLNILSVKYYALVKLLNCVPIRYQFNFFLGPEDGFIKKEIINAKSDEQCYYDIVHLCVYKHFPKHTFLYKFFCDEFLHKHVSQHIKCKYYAFVKLFNFVPIQYQFNFFL